MSTVGKSIVLRSSDNEIFEIEEMVAIKSQTIKNMIDDGCADSEIPLPNVDGKTLAMVIEYCKKIVGSSELKAELKKFEAEFMNVNQKTLFDLILAANYLNIKTLLDLTCQTVADMIKGKSPQQIRDIFNIPNDFTPEEEEEIRRENEWAFAGFND